MGILLVVGGVLGVIATAVGAVKPLREDVFGGLHELYVRWRPWRMELSPDWLTREVRASLIRGDDGTEIPYVVRNRGPNRAANITLTRTFRQGGYMAVSIENLGPRAVSKSFSFPNRGLKRLWLTVDWDEASSRRQRVHLPKFRLMSRADRKMIRDSERHRRRSH